MRHLRPAVLPLLAALLASPLVALPAAARAQLPPQPPAAGAPADSTPGVYARARRLVSEGDGPAGRTLVDSLLAAATAGSPAYAEALYWRAMLAERAADAERDYRRLAVEYGFSPRASDALVRLAQLDLVRGQPAAARAHLERLLRDHPDAATQGRGQYWLARAHLDAGDARAACTSLGAAAAVAAPGSELARLVAGLRPRIARCGAALAAAPAPAAPTPDTAAATAPAVSAPAVSAPAVSAPAVSAPAADVGRYTVQVAAYATRAGADELAERLVRAGLAARVSAQGPNADRPPFRVRVGRYATAAEAAAALRDLRRRRLTGFVTAAEPAAARP